MEFIKSLHHHHKSSHHELNSNFQTIDWSSQLSRNASNLFSVAKTLEFGLPGQVTAIGHDPLQSLLAVGTSVGSLHVWGAPGVYLTWKNRPAHHIKHLCFKPGSPLLCCIDVKDTLYVYNLNLLQDGVPFRESSHSIRSVVMCFAVSPAHSHMFLGLKDGSVDCYDLDRGVVSPYRIRNLWLEYNELLRRSGVPGAPSRRHIPICTDIKCHPFDLNLILIGHEGGISLYDLKKQSVLRSFELVIPPGAIGSTQSSNSSTIFEERRPGVTCLCFRPDGEMFVSGHLDGCLAFWSLDDGDMPIMVRTLERDDVMTFDWSETDPQTNQNASVPSEDSVREPIFRISWSTFPTEPTRPHLFKYASASEDSTDQTEANDSQSVKDGGLLTVLGGLMPGDSTGVHVLHLPPYRSHSTGLTPTEITFEVRASLRASLSPIGRSIYPTPGPPEDFILVPRNNPYFDGSYDPVGIIISTGAHLDVPTSFFPSRMLSGDPATGNDQPLSARSLLSFAYPPRLDHKARPFQLPGAFDWIGTRTVLGCHIFELTESAFRQLLKTPPPSRTGQDQMRSTTRIPLNGGQATVSPSFLQSEPSAQDAPSELIQEFQKKYRVMVTIHVDQKIRFWDFSMRLLLPVMPSDQILSAEASRGLPDQGNLRTEFPAKLDHLTIDLTAFRTQASRLFPKNHLDPPIRLTLSSDSLDLSLTFPRGEILVYQYRQAQFNPSSASDMTIGFPEYHLSMSKHPGSNEKDLSVTVSPTIALPSAQDMTALTEAVGKPLVPAPSDPLDANKPSASAHESDMPTSSISPKTSVPDMSSSVSRPAQPPPRPPRSVKRVNKDTQAPINTALPRSETSEASPREAKEPDLPTQTQFHDLSDIQSHYDTRDGFRPAIWLPSTKFDLTHKDVSDDLRSSVSTKPPPDSVVALSDMGFMAVAQVDRSRVKIFDLRHVKTLFDSDAFPAGKGKQKAKDRGVRSLTWTISALYTDALALPRLLVGYEDGSFDIVKLFPSQSHKIDNWTATALSNDGFGPEKGHSDSPIECFVFNEEGNVKLANVNNLRAALSDEIPSKPVTEDDQEGPCLKSTIESLLIVVSSRSVIVRLNINGPILLRKEDITPEPLIKATIITYQSSSALLLIDQKRSCYVLSLPNLDLICKTFLPVLNGLDSVGQLSIDSTADVIEQVNLTTTHLTTLLVGRDSAYTPYVVAHNENIRTPDAPQPKTSVIASASALASNLVSWFQGTMPPQAGSSSESGSNSSSTARVTGAELDHILAGPLRPERRASALQPPRSLPPRSPQVVVPGRGQTLMNNSTRRTSSTATDSKHLYHSTTNSSPNSQRTQMSKNFNELDERGEKLDQLNDRFDELSLAASQLVQQAKRIGQQQAAKAGFSSGLSGVKSLFK